MGMAPADATLLPCLRSATKGDALVHRIHTPAALYDHLEGCFRLPAIMAADPRMSMYP